MGGRGFILNILQTSKCKVVELGATHLGPFLKFKIALFLIIEDHGVKNFLIFVMSLIDLKSIKHLKAVHVPGRRRKRTRRRKSSFVLDKACDEQTRPQYYDSLKDGWVHSSCISSRTNQSFGFRLRFRLGT